MSKFARSLTVVLAAVTAVAWLAAVLTGQNEAASLSMGFIPARIGGDAVPWAAVPAFLSPLTSTLVHAGLLHLGFNLLIFVYCGLAVERVLGWTGLIVLYVVGAYASALAQWSVYPMSVIPMIGASGAISAVIGAYSLSFGRPKAITGSARINRWINAAWLMASWVVLQVMVGWLAGAQGVLMATAAHIGGFAAGILLQRPLLLWRYRSA